MMRPIHLKLTRFLLGATSQAHGFAGAVGRFAANRTSNALFFAGAAGPRTSATGLSIAPVPSEGKILFEIIFGSR